MPQYNTQLRYIDLESAIDFYTRQLGFELAFRYDDFYAGVEIGEQVLHLKLVDDADPNINWVQKNDHLHLMLLIDDLDTWQKEPLSKGLAVSAIQDKPWFRSLVSFAG
ncbi:MAG: catechol 2,3-dioxygenase-like lactoylglutathione lyase family enzyme [Patiriisocius sp.]|jgi:catechol 2,3-dioxygenase-like lactoylglutathione lyase family enzyme